MKIYPLRHGVSFHPSLPFFLSVSIKRCEKTTIKVLIESLRIQLITSQKQPLAPRDIINSSRISEYHPNLTLQKAGFYVGEPGYLGASPDGILIDDTGCVQGIIEIKCPYSAAKLTVREACSECCTLDEDSQISLDRYHVYYYQILGTMANKCIIL